MFNVKVYMTIPISDAAYTPKAVSLNLCVLSRIMPHITEPIIPANTITRPILPASSLAP